MRLHVHIETVVPQIPLHSAAKEIVDMLHKETKHFPSFEIYAKHIYIVGMIQSKTTNTPEAFYSKKVYTVEGELQL